MAPPRGEHRARGHPGDVLAHGTGDRSGAVRPHPRAIRRALDDPRDDRPHHRERQQRGRRIRRHRGERRAPRCAPHHLGAACRTRGVDAGGVLQLPLRRARPLRAGARVPRLPDLRLHPAARLARRDVGVHPLGPDQSVGPRLRARARRHHDHSVPPLLHAGLGGGQGRRSPVGDVRARRRVPRRRTGGTLRVLHRRGPWSRSPVRTRACCSRWASAARHCSVRW